MPASSFKNSRELVKDYHDATYLKDLSADELQQLADAYMQELQQAQKDSRYFGRHSDEIRSRFKKDEQKALMALEEFLASHGFQSKLPQERKSDLLHYYDVESSVVHQTDPGFSTSPENKG